METAMPAGATRAATDPCMKIPFTRPARWIGCIVALTAAVAGAQVPPGPGGPPTGIDAGRPADLLDLDAAVSLALARNPDLAAALRETEAAAALRVQATLRPNPSLGLDVERADRRADGIVLSQPLEPPGRRAARIDFAERGLDAARAGIAQRRAELRALVIQRFHELALAQDRLALALQSRALAERVLRTAERRVQAGRVSPVEETRARVALGGAQVEVSQAVLQRDNARRRLGALWGEDEPAFGDVRAEGTDPPPLPADDELLRRVEAAPALRVAQAELDRRESAVELARRARLPVTVVSAGTRTLIETGQRATVLGVSVALPVFDLNQGNILEAQARAGQGAQLLDAARRRTLAEARQARARAETADRDLRRIRDDILPGAESALDATTRGYELGRFGFLEVLDAQRSLFATRGQLLQARGEALAARAELERLLGPSPGATDMDEPTRMTFPPR